LLLYANDNIYHIIISNISYFSMKNIAPPPFAVGTIITPVESTKPIDITIDYKHGSVLGIGGDQNVSFSVHTFKTPAG
jgi:hypothetical protein